MVRRPIDDDEDNPERWLVSYADFITLLFAFFVVMYSVSSVNQGKYKELSDSINVAFTKSKTKPESNAQATTDTPTAITSTTQEQVAQPPLPSSAPSEAQQLEVDAMTKLGKAIANKLSPLIKTGKARIIQNKKGLRIDIKDSVLFTKGSADLIDTARALLSEIATLLRLRSHPVLVEGHTDNTPVYIRNAAFFSNWELSAVRASSVVSQFSQVGIEKMRLSALGYGPSQPIGDNNTPEGRETNRHISIMIVYESLDIDDDIDTVIKPD